MAHIVKTERAALSPPPDILQMADVLHFALESDPAMLKRWKRFTKRYPAHQVRLVKSAYQARHAAQEETDSELAAAVTKAASRPLPVYEGTADPRLREYAWPDLYDPDPRVREAAWQRMQSP